MKRTLKISRENLKNRCFFSAKREITGKVSKDNEAEFLATVIMEIEKANAVKKAS